MLKGIAGFDVLPKVTGLLVDVSGSMNYRLAKKARPRGWMLPRVWRFFFVKRRRISRGHVLRQVRHHSAVARVRAARRNCELASSRPQHRQVAR